MNRYSAAVELEISVRRLREKFHGKIPIDKATLLMRRYSIDHSMVAKEIILMKDRELDEEDKWVLENDPDVKNVVEKLQNEEREKQERRSERRRSSGAGNDPGTSRQTNANKGPNKDKDIKELAQRLRVLPLTVENMRMFDQAQQNLIPSDDHQFACQQCDKSWWRRVPTRKKVSRCKRCRRKYDPVPWTQMWGIAEFYCTKCARSFKGFGRMDLGSPCYSCRCIVLPSRILPPRRSVMDRGRKRHQHSCLAEDCFNRQEPYVPGTECVHPISRKRNGKPAVVNPSGLHISSGSTVNTCLSQGSLMEDLSELVLEDIEEEASCESYSHNSDSSNRSGEN